MNLTFVALTFASGQFLTGYGIYDPVNGSEWAVTKDEEAYVLAYMPEVNACPDSDCRATKARAIIEVINLRRQLDQSGWSDPIFNALRQPCEQINEVIPQRDCFKVRAAMAFEEGMEASGFGRAGITRLGYQRCRPGLRLREIEHILGSSGEEVSYSSGFGIYSWRRGRAIITISFANGRSTGRAQMGL